MATVSHEWRTSRRSGVPEQVPRPEVTVGIVRSEEQAHEALPDDGEVQKLIAAIKAMETKNQTAKATPIVLNAQNLETIKDLVEQLEVAVNNKDQEVQYSIIEELLDM